MPTSGIEKNDDDARLLAVALARTLTDSGRRYGLDEAARELGMDLTDRGVTSG